jgi:hypothetical protein
MIAARITPRVVAAGLALQLAGWLLLDLLEQGTASRQLAIAKAAFRTLLTLVACGAALLLNLEVASEYRHARWLRLAWLALAANAGLSMVRWMVESRLIDYFAPGYARGGMLGLLQHLVLIPGNLCFLAGVLAMWAAYHRVGLGFGLERRDWAAMAGVMVLTIGLLVFRENLTEAQSPYLVSRVLQRVGLGLLSLCLAVSLVLHRLAMQMGGGRLATALRWLVVFIALRATLVLLGALRREWLPAGLPDRYLFELGWQIVPWTMALAASARAELTVRAARELAARRASRDAFASV